MRINFISPPAHTSGGLKVIAIHARSLTQRGHDVCVVSPPPPAVPFAAKLKLWLKGEGWPDDRSQTNSPLDGAGFNHHVIDRYRPVTDDDVPDGDVVIATWWETAEWVAALNARKGAKVYFIQGHEIYNFLPYERTRATYFLPFHKIVVSRWLQRVMSEHYGDRNVDVVSNSIDRTQFFAPLRGKQPTPTIGFLYSTSHPKGVDTTLASLRIVRERIPHLRMMSFGRELPRGRLEMLRGIEFKHSPAQHEIRDLYGHCDAWIAASRNEGFNLPALEAMACRTPVVSTRTGWPEEVLQSRWNGILVDIDDVAGLAAGVAWILTRTDVEWRSLSANAYVTASKGSWQESAKMFESALKYACRRAARGEIAGGVAASNH
jgi:glycosyltransferase involved in cell wall biosynthesis